ncbi:MAG: RNA polymerase sigma factor, partial [Aureliella sp.]
EGDRSAADELFSIHSDRLRLFIRAKLGSRLRAKVEPDDVLQDAYAAALKSFGEFQYTDDGAFLRWMCRIIDNRLRDAHDYFAAGKRQERPVPRSAPTGPLTALDRAENRLRIESELENLSPEHREVILLRYFQGLSTEEAAQRMNRTAGAVRNLLARALVELGKGLK